MTRAALETLVIALQHGLTTAQAELALDVTASAIAGDRNLTVTALAGHLGAALCQPRRRDLTLLADHTARLCGSTLPYEDALVRHED